MCHCTQDCCIRKINSQFVSLGTDTQVIVQQMYIGTVKRTFQTKRLTKEKLIREEESH